MMWDAGSGMGWWVLWGDVAMALFWAGIVALAVWVVQSAWGNNSALRHVPRRGGSAEEIARRRYARGEITLDQYKRIIEDLRRATSPAR